MLSELWSDLRYRARALFRSGTLERELDDELSFHLEREAQKHVRAGMLHDEAVRHAHLAFGGLNRIKDDTRDTRGIAVVESILRDTRYALRTLRARPGFTAGVVITLGLGIGVNAAMFGVLDRLLVRAPEYMIAPDRVHRVYVGWMNQATLRRERSIEYTRYTDLARWTGSFDATAAFGYRQMAIGEGEDVRRAVVGVVSASYFSFFSAQPVLGRYFTAAEDTTPSGAPVAVLTYEYWQSRYDGRRDVVGARVKLDRLTYSIIGVAPKGFVGVADQQAPIAFIPITTFSATITSNYYRTYNWSWLEMLVRRKPDVSVEASTADLSNAYRRSWDAEVTATGGGPPVSTAKPRAEAFPLPLGRGPSAGPETRVMIWMSAVAVIVLLIACANITNLLLVRSLRRRREMAVRLALGGTRGRLIQQLFAETMVLSLIGGTVGVLAAQLGGGALRRVFLDAAPDATVVADPRTLIFSMAASVGAALVAGLVPALRLDAGRSADALRAGAREGAYAHSRTRSLLLVVQAALCVVLLVGAGLFIRSLREVRHIRLGYDVDPLLVVEVDLRDTKLTRDQAADLRYRVQSEAAGLAGVASVTQAVTIPFYGSERHPIYVPGIDSVNERGRFTMQVGTADYFKTTGTRIVRGRGFTAQDRRETPLVGVVSEAMANVLWPGGDAIGKCFKVNADTVPCTTVVGIAENIRARSLMGDAEFQYYLPAEQFETDTRLLVRVNGVGVEHAEAVRRDLQRVMPGSVYVAVLPMSRLLGAAMRSWRSGATIFMAFGVLALVLAAVGLYSVVAFAVTQRTHELGLRIALGAQVDDVLRLVIGEGIGIALLGVGVGFAIALAAGSMVSPLLYRVSPRDPLTYVVVGGLLVVVAMIASAVPAIRATKVDPNIALRTE